MPVFHVPNIICLDLYALPLSGAGKGLQSSLRPPQNKRMNVMRAFIGVDRFQINHMPHDVIFLGNAIAAMHVA